MNLELKEGEIVNVFGSPLYGIDFEGQAELLEQITPEAEDGLSSWIVSFLEDLDKNEFQRTIYIGNARESGWFK